MDNLKLTRVATYASVSVALLLILIKLLAWWMTSSVSILASLLDSMLDVVASFMILLAVRIAQVPPDQEHRFGHGKAEPLAALAQSVFILGSVFYLLVYAVDRLFHPQEVVAVPAGITIMVASTLLTALLIAFQKYVIHKTKSTIIEADSLHYISDLGANIIVIFGLVLTVWNIDWIDPVLAIGIALIIGISALKLAKESANQLLDIELPDEMREQIQKIILSHREAEGYNDLRTYRSGPNVVIQFDLELSDGMPLIKAHRIAEEITDLIKDEIPCADVTIHQEPVSLRSDPQHHQWGDS